MGAVLEQHLRRPRVAITDEDHINKDVPDRVYKYGVY